MDLKITPAGRIEGTVFVPGDKSISHRALIFAALAEGTSNIANLLTAADCLSTLECLRNLGVEIELFGTQVRVRGVGLKGLREPADVLNVGNSGTTLRILPGVLAGQNFFSVLTGDASVRSRPMDRIIIPLRRMGADIRGRTGDSRAPIAISGRQLTGILYATPVASAQIKTSVLLAGLLAEGETSVTESHQSRDHTERFFDFLEIENRRRSGPDGEATISVTASSYKARDMIVAGDISSAAFFIAAGLLVAKSELLIVDVGLNPTRIGILEVLQMMGAEIEITDQKVLANEPVGTLLVRSLALKSVEIAGALIPRVIDELPVLAVLATQAEGQTIVKDAAELRVKESDRIANLTKELKKMGARIEEREDGFAIDGPTLLRGAVVDSHGDHRLAMSLAVAGLIAKGETNIQNADCIAISYPNFETTLRGIAKE